MEGTYDVYLGKESVGQVRVAKEGLYYRFDCSCRLSGDVCKLHISSEGREENLGTLIPEGASFCLKARVPVKRLGTGKPNFFVVPNRPVLTGKFIPISPEEPFAYLERLKDSYLEVRSGQLGVVVSKLPGE